MVVPIVSNSLGPKRAAAPQCSIHEPLFSLYSKPKKAKRWTAEIPSPQASEEAGDDKIRSEFAAFVVHVTELERRGCLPPNSSLSLVPFVAESLAVPLTETLFYRYSYRSGQGIVDLVPGMRLEIQRAEFTTPSEDEQKLANYIGERTCFYEVRGHRGNELALRLTKVKASGGLAGPPAPDLPEFSLPSQIAGARIARLFLLTLFVSKGRKRAAIVVGARQLRQMQEATAAIANDPLIQCSAIEAQGASCVAFEGNVTVSSEIAVNVNGQRRYVLLKSSVGDIIAQARGAWEDVVPQSLAVTRLFHGKHVPVEFDHSDQTILKLPALAGDRLTWVQKPAQD